MNLSLNPDIAKLIEQRVHDGRYPTPEAVVTAALQSLEQQERFGDFEAGELDELLAEGERSIEEEGLVDVDAAFRKREERLAQGRQ